MGTPCDPDAAGWCWVSDRSPQAPTPASAFGRAYGSSPSRHPVTPPPSGVSHRTGTRDGVRRSDASPPDRPASPELADNISSSARPAADGIARRLAGPGPHGPPAPAVPAGSWRRPFAKKIPLHRQLADFLIQRRQQGFVRRRIAL